MGARSLIHRHLRKIQKGSPSLDSCTNDMCESQCRCQVGSSLSLSSSLANKAKKNTDSCFLSGKPSNNLSYISNSLSEPLDAKAWSLIESLTVNDILSSTVPCTVSRVPNVAVSVFHKCCAIPLERIASDSSDAVAWKLLMLVPRMALTPPKRGGRAGCKEIHNLCQKFLEYC